MQYLFDLENTNQELKSDLKDLYINSATYVLQRVLYFLMVCNFLLIMRITYLIPQSAGCFWKSQGSGDICSLQIAEVLPQDSSSPCQRTGEKIQWQGNVLFFLFLCILIDNVIYCQCPDLVWQVTQCDAIMCFLLTFFNNVK